MFAVKSSVCTVNSWKNKKRQKEQYYAANKDQIGTFHNNQG